MVFSSYHNNVLIIRGTCSKYLKNLTRTRYALYGADGIPPVVLKFRVLIQSVLVGDQSQPSNYIISLWSLVCLNYQNVIWSANLKKSLLLMTFSPIVSTVSVRTKSDTPHTRPSLCLIHLQTWPQGGTTSVISPPELLGNTWWWEFLPWSRKILWNRQVSERFPTTVYNIFNISWRNTDRACRNSGTPRLTKMTNHMNGYLFFCSARHTYTFSTVTSP